MDRLVCGDVGFGKTEVALRASFRAVSEGRQVAMLCPTTVLAEQHYQTFRARLSGFPVHVGLLSRFISRARQKEIIREAAAGQIDILIGTHRLLSNDVKLPNLSLLILDEEQRFGVRHKEKLKSLKKNVDALTLTATPIPRTLQLSMSGIRELSVIETAPQDRKPVATAILRRDDAVLASVIARELERKGQVFWVYNRVQGLERVAEYAQKLAPQARVGIAHGQMHEKSLEENMHKFWHGELDILVCTAIVESGLDFPLANTLIVDQAQMFGMGQLYQLRGRVGRSDRQAYAYFIVPDTERLNDRAGERLRIIRDMDYLGAGFQLAMEDLRLRGAGNILGEMQSGHMGRVGLDLYLEMLEECVSRLKGDIRGQTAETEITLGLPAHIPASYVEDSRERLRFYKALTSAQDGAAREETALALRDRFGPLPEELDNFLAVLDLKQFLGQLQVARAEVRRETLRLTWADGQTAVQPESLVELAAKTPNARLHPPSGLTLPLPGNTFAEGLQTLQNMLKRSRADSRYAR
jgi:transcription-repair coupling factor (superfamily II helicase)